MQAGLGGITIIIFVKPSIVWAGKATLDFSSLLQQNIFNQHWLSAYVMLILRLHKALIVGGHCRVTPNPTIENKISNTL
jgi:hypothetical protein